MPDPLSEFYETFYSRTQYTGAMGKFHDLYHRAIEKGHHSNKELRILEVGAGFAEHLNFVSLDFKEYVISDLNLQENNEHMKHNIEGLGLTDDPRLKFVTCDISSIPYDDGYFDRVIITCVLHHVKDLEKALVEIRRVTKDGGTVSIYVPCDPGFVYRLIRHFASHRKQMRVMQAEMGYVKYIWSLEHINHFPGIIAKINWIFKADKIHWRGLSKFISYDFSIFKCLEISLNKETQRK